jgi:hypothetical protein
MRDRSRPPTELTAGSNAPERSASALREHISQELAAESRASGRTHSKSVRAHSKSVPDGRAIPNLSASNRSD